MDIGAIDISKLKCVFVCVHVVFMCASVCVSASLCVCVLDNVYRSRVCW